MCITRLFRAVLDLSTCDAVATRGDGYVCYTVRQIQYDWADALQACAARNTTLLTVLSDAETAAVATLLDSKAFADSWLGAVEVNQDWRWLDGKNDFHTTLSLGFWFFARFYGL